MCCFPGRGISSYAANPLGAAESLRDCLEEAVAHIPQAQHRETPLFLGATAGMRLLRYAHIPAGLQTRWRLCAGAPAGSSSPPSQKNSSQAAEVFDAVSQVLAQSPLDFRGAEILSGRDEGAYGWITANYLLGRLVKVGQGSLGAWPGGREPGCGLSLPCV